LKTTRRVIAHAPLTGVDDPSPRRLLDFVSRRTVLDLPVSELPGGRRPGTSLDAAVLQAAVRKVERGTNQTDRFLACPGRPTSREPMNPAPPVTRVMSGTA
jgi:hypothetical protein